MRSFYKRIKDKLYFLKRWYLLVFTYPQDHLVPHDSLNYDEYWKEKRGSSVDARIRNITGNERMRADFVVSKIGISDVSVGDIASGPGVIFNYLKDRLRLREYIGYEYSAYARSVAESLGMRAVPFDINSDTDLQSIKKADYFLMLEILEHIPHSEQVLAITYEKANKGVFFSFPNSENFLYRMRLLFGRMPMQWIKYPNEHLRFWTLTDLRWWLRAQGYTNHVIHCYRGVPFLEKIWPSLFAGSFVVFIPK